MYNVMLADDDYPVLELLSQSIDWESLGFRLIGTFENGATAWEHAQQEMPDLLITDIGMPRMDGLELSAKIKERKRDTRIIILSCHDEFSYAQQAMRLNVQDYVLKESLQPDDLSRMVERLRKGLDEERHISGEQLRLHALVNHTQELRKEQFYKNFIHQPLLTPEKWLEEAHSYGLFIGCEAILAAVGHIDDFPSIKHRFASGETLKFALANVMQEAVAQLDLHMQYVPYSDRKLLLLIAYKPGLKTNIYDQASASIRLIQATLRRVLKLRTTFVLGTECGSPEGLKRNLQMLLKDEGQRFYLEAGSLVKLAPAVLTDQDIFQYYDEASLDLREAMIGKRPADACKSAERWMDRIQSERFPPAAVKDWVLKLLLDLKMKLRTLQYIRTGYTANALQQEIADLDSCSELREWLSAQLMIAAEDEGTGSGSKRPEVKEACKYVSLHLNRKIGLDEIAEMLHLNASYFSRMFKKETGETFIEYVTRMKMERAKEMLDQTSQTVGEICEHLGYDNQSYFIKTFKTHSGVTPVEYRG